MGNQRSQVELIQPNSYVSRTPTSALRALFISGVKERCEDMTPEERKRFRQGLHGFMAARPHTIIWQ
jgi:hypothetical protein